MSLRNEKNLTEYERKVLDADSVKLRYNVLASLYSWLLLAGFLVFPGTFTSLSKATAIKQNEPGILIQKAVQKMPLFWVALVCCMVGAAGLFWLWWKLKNSYVWLVTKIFVPCLLNSAMGLITVGINVQTAQSGHWSEGAQITISIIGTTFATSLLLFLSYKFYFLERLK
ncbi:hypothetical protein V8F06_014544 [Rhypophila decipiens]